MKGINSFIIGKISKTHSFKGNLLIVCEHKELIDIIEEEQVMFIYISEKPVPFFIESIRQTNQYNLLVKFEDIENEMTARQYVGLKVGIDTKYLEVVNKSPNITPSILHNIIGFSVVDKNFGVIGTLKSIMEHPCQLIMDVEHKTKSILIPYNEKLVVNVDHDLKLINVVCPEGLIELYLNETSP